MRITLLPATMGCLVQAEDGRDCFFQFESDFVGLARYFGMRFADISESQPLSIRDFLDERMGMSIDDPGYFD